MFTGQPIPPYVPAIIDEAAYADGFVYLCLQSALGFGSNRRIPVAKRPVTAVRPDGAWVIVLPNTSQDHSNDPNFFELTPERVRWLQASEQPSFVYYRYETVSVEVLGRKKIGVMSHPARLDLMSWLKERY